MTYSLLPAATVGWFLYRSNAQSVQLLSGKIIEDMSARIKAGVKNHLAQAHTVLNGMIHEQPDAPAVLRAAPATLALPIIALTASVLEEDRQRCVEAGMVGFLPKPLRMDELSEALTCHARQPAHQNATKVTAVDAMPATQGAPADLEPGPLLIDWIRLDQFREFDDEALSMTREVVQLFITELPQRTGDIQSALDDGNSMALSRAAHALKGAASNVGTQALSNACSALEQSCQQGQWPADAAVQVAGLMVLADKTCQLLCDWTEAQALA